MKKLFLILLAALCALLPAFSALAESTTLLTTVPSTHTITIICGNHGDVVIDGKTYSGTFTIEAERLGTLVITADPDSGYGLSQIVAEDLTGVTIKGRKATLTSIHDENTLTISFYKLPVEDDEDDADDEETTPGTETFEPMPDVDDPILGELTLGDVVELSEVDPTDNVLYDEYIGTGGGLWQTSIVFDGDYLPEDYELLGMLVDDELQGNSVLVCAYPDEEGKVARRSLILSADQLVKLTQKQETEHVIFENGDAIAVIDMVDLLGGDLQKLMALILSGEEEITPETLERDWSEIEPVVIPADQLAKIKVEIRIVPVELEDGSIVYEISVWLRWDDQELDVSAMIPSLTVCLAVDDLVNEENFDAFTTLYTMAHQALADEANPDAAPEIIALESALLLIPDELPEHQADEAERFIVTIPEDGSHPVAAYDANAHLLPYRHYVLAASYAGEGYYMVAQLDAE